MTQTANEHTWTDWQPDAHMPSAYGEAIALHRRDTGHRTLDFFWESRCLDCPWQAVLAVASGDPFDPNRSGELCWKGYAPSGPLIPAPPHQHGGSPCATLKSAARFTVMLRLGKG